LVVCLIASVARAKDDISATGTLFITFDIGIKGDWEGVLYARLVPDQVSLVHFPLMLSHDPPGPIHYVSFEAPLMDLAALVGREEADRLARDPHRVIAVPVSILLSDLHALEECDYPVYYARLVSVQPVGAYRAASRDADAPVGC